ncbi:MAG: FixH family protein [Phycisphaerae bacterium]|nr:FixH family protein [Phycisphaerae bacterium]
MRPSTRWPLFVLLIALTSLSGGAWLTYSALSDPSFAVEPDYYSKAVKWDERSRQSSENRRLGWVLTLSQENPGRAVVRLADDRGGAIAGARISAVAFANARAAERTDLAFRDDGAGVYSAEFRPARVGLWRFRFEAEHGADRFTSEFDLFIGAASGDGGAP